MEDEKQEPNGEPSPASEPSTAEPPGPEEPTYVALRLSWALYVSLVLGVYVGIASPRHAWIGWAIAVASAIVLWSQWTRAAQKPTPPARTEPPPPMGDAERAAREEVFGEVVEEEEV